MGAGAAGFAGTDSLRRVSRSYVIYIGLLAAFWGASYMFIKVANRAFEPATCRTLQSSPRQDSVDCQPP